MITKKNKYLFHSAVLFLVLQFIICCSCICAQDVKTAQQNHPTISHAGKQHSTKNHYKKYSRHYRKYHQYTYKTKAVIKPEQKIIREKTNTQTNKPNIEQEKLNLPENNSAYDNIQKGKPAKGFNFIMTSFSLLIVLGMIFAVAWLYSKLKNIDPALLASGKLKEKSSDKFNILSTATLGQGRNIHLVEINGKHLVIGSTMNNISLLTELPSTDTGNPNNTSKQPLEEDEFTDNENYESGYNEIYKEYLKEKDIKPNPDKDN